MPDCIFCKIVKGELPSAKIYEDDRILAFLDIAPNNHGHTLVIPKEHYQDFLDMPDETIKDLFASSKKIAKAVQKGTGAEAFNIGMNNGKHAGQIVYHAHIHIIPRFANDGLKHWPSKKYEGTQMEEFKKKIVKHL